MSVAAKSVSKLKQYADSSVNYAEKVFMKLATCGNLIKLISA
jgi:hypothetical protein